MTVIAKPFRPARTAFSISRAALVAACLIAPACAGGDEDGDSDASDDEAGDDGELGEVADVEGVYELSSTCVSLAPDETVASISPEGYAWLASDTSGGSVYRVVSPGGNFSVVELEIDAGYLQAWGESRATYTGDGIMWRTEGMLTEPLYWSEQLPSPTRFCGDPTIDGDGFVLAGTELSQRDAGLWWRWLTPEGEDYGPISLLGTSYGACTDREGALWLANVAGETWRLAPDAAQLVPELAGTSALVIDAPRS